MCDVIEKSSEGASTILLWIFDLFAKFSWRTSGKHHLMRGRGKRPLRITRRHVRTRKIRCLMARIAPHTVHSVPVLAPLYVLKMQVAIISLKGRIARGMTVLAAGRS